MLDLQFARVILDALTLLERCAQSPLAVADRQDCARVAAVLRDFVGERTRAVPDDIARAAEARWANNPGVKLERPLAMRVDVDGVFVAAWLRAGEPLEHRHSATAIDAGLATVPVIAREVFLFHRRDDMRFEAIAERLALTQDEVAEQFIVALLAISTEVRWRATAARASPPRF